MTLPHEPAEHPRVRARAPGMPDHFAIHHYESAVARDDHVRIAIRLIGRSLRNHEEDDEPALFSMQRESFRGEALARGGPENVVIRDP